MIMDSMTKLCEIVILTRLVSSLKMYEYVRRNRAISNVTKVSSRRDYHLGVITYDRTNICISTNILVQNTHYNVIDIES